MTACEHMISRMHLLLDRELSPDDERKLRKHLGACPACAEEMEQLEQMKTVLEEGLGAKLPIPGDAAIINRATEAGAKSRPRRRVLRILKKTAIAAAAAIIVIAAAGYLFTSFYFQRTFPSELDQRVIRNSDGIEIKRGFGEWRPLRAGDRLMKATRMRTPAAAKSFMSFDGVRILTEGEVELENDGARDFSILSGELVIASTHRDKPVEIGLGTTSVQVNGGVIQIKRTEGSTSLGVASGVTEVAGRDGTVHRVEAAQRVTFGEDLADFKVAAAEVADPFARRKTLALDRARQRFDQVIAKYLPNYRMTRQSGGDFRFADLIDQWSRPDEMYQFASYTPNTQHRLARATSADVGEYYESLFAPSNRAIAMGRQSTVRLRPGKAPGTSAWSHDGTMLAFIEAAENSPYARVRVVRLDDLENPWDISQECESVIAFQQVAWAPDNRHVLFTMDDNMEVDDEGRWEWKGPFKIKIAPIDPEQGPLRDFISPFRDIPVSTQLIMGKTVSPHILKLPWGDALLCTNWGNIGYIPIEQDGQSAPRAPGLHLTDFNPRKVLVLGAQWSPSASMIMFTVVEDFDFGQFKTYILHDVEDILDGFTDPPQSLDDPRIRWIAPTRNYQVRGGFSYDESLAFFEEDVNQGWDPRNPTYLQNCDFDLLYASVLPEGGSGVVQIHVPGSQLFMMPSPEGNRLAYSNYAFENKRGSRREGKGELRVVSFDIETEVDVDLGGFLMDNSGTNLIVPPGALKDNFSIKISTPFSVGEEAGLTEGDDTFFAMRLIDAKGLDKPQFIEPMTLTIRYTDDEVEGLDEGMLEIYYYDESDSDNPVWIPLGGTVDPEYNEITVEIRHFSKFCIAGKKRE